MEERNIYQDISKRTNGDIYIGIVGPVRSGKSTFIKKFMDTLVIPNISDETQRLRAIDELPQSAAGRTIMTTEPKFIPEDAVEVNIDNKASFKARMIDCVGYIIPSSIGYIEQDQPRMVKTPWYEEEIPFNMAAEIGTKKVITDHCTIGLVITTDASIGDIDRNEYEEAEKRVINELKEINKPFIVLLNSLYPESESVKTLAEKLSLEYEVPVVPINCSEIDENGIKCILAELLFEFPIKEVKINIPKWLNLLEKDHWLRNDIYSCIKNTAKEISKINELEKMTDSLLNCKYVKDAKISSIDLGSGCSFVDVNLNSDLFYKVIGEKTGIDIVDECSLMNCMMNLAKTRQKYKKIADAYEEVEQSQYSIIMPTMEELELEEPEIIKQNGKYGVKLKANASSIHMMKTNIQAEVTPIVGSEQQSEELVSYLLREFEENPSKIWESNIFGKSLHELINESLQGKLYRMPPEAREKIKETVERVINEGCNGLICIIL